MKHLFLVSIKPAAGQPRGTTPSSFWILEDAVTHAIEVVRDHDKDPWIKVEGITLGPSAISQAYSGLKAMRMFDADRN